MSSHLLAAVEEPLQFRLHVEELCDFETQLVHLGEFGQGIHPVGFLPIHCAHLNPHCSCPVSTAKPWPITTTTIIAFILQDIRNLIHRPFFKFIYTQFSLRRENDGVNISLFPMRSLRKIIDHVSIYHEDTTWPCRVWTPYSATWHADSANNVNNWGRAHSAGQTVWWQMSILTHIPLLTDILARLEY